MLTDSTTEVQRLREVYARYAEGGCAHSKWSDANPGNQHIARERQSCLRTMLEAGGFIPFDQRRILDVGCGTGNVLAGFQAWGASAKGLYGVDLLPDRIRIAEQNHPHLQFRVGNAAALPFPDGFFDLVMLFTVFSSILDDDLAQSVANEASRVLRRGGAVIWYDLRFNNPWNRNVRGMSRAALRQLFPEFVLQLRSITLLPPLARRLGQPTNRLYPALARLPFLRSHYLGLFLKPTHASI